MKERTNEQTNGYDAYLYSTLHMIVVHIFNCTMCAFNTRFVGTRYNRFADLLNVRCNFSNMLVFIGNECVKIGWKISGTQIRGVCYSVIAMAMLK